MNVLQVLLVLAFLLALYFPVMLILRSDWNANPPIRAVLVFSLVVAGVLLLSVLRSFGVTLPEWTRIAAFLAIIGALIVQDVTLTKTQNRRSARIARERESIKEPS